MLLYLPLRSPVLATRCRAFRAPTTPIPLRPRPPARRSLPLPRQVKMAWEDMLHDHHPRSRQPPHVRQVVQTLKASVHQGDKGLPPSFSKNKEHLQVVLGTGDSPARGECSTKIGSPDLCGSVPSVSFDICLPQKARPIKLNPSLLQQNREKRKEREQAKISNQNMRLQPGMILLKNFLKHNDQVEIIGQCQRLGVGSGGFYQPGYEDGAKLSLQMMCLGKNWDPQTSLYEDIRRVDGTKAPQIPLHFKKLVEEAIQASHALVQQHTGSSHPVKAELPNMLPDLCIVNFYSNNGKLGLHQDKDESRESLDQGLPVVSFSLGDTADFLYGDSRDVNKANSVRLENGDVLIFGGQSRHIFHGVLRIHPGTAPKRLVEETLLRPGRLNLTFRQF
ncbi:hypothetical protein Taro_050213 [Colocasia esculenta]|uniref:Fe2OG dioxygenase domain-containing protein n=1 Tax=Colocasia esculenta TaxID=4460 RepID=A0A843XD88_COLES|nr:hypothetical protein [Colocasia esculenta]